MKFNRTAAKLSAVFLAGALLLTGCSPAKSGKTLINIGDGKDKITLGYGNFVAKYYEAMYYIAYGSYFGGSSMWGQSGGGDETMEESVKSNIIDSIEEAYLCKAHADDYGITLSDDDKKKIEDAADKFMENDSSAIKALGATRQYVVDYLTYEAYQSKVKPKVEDEADTTVSDDESQQAKFSYVHFSTEGSTDTTTGTSTEMSDDDKAAVKANADALAAAGAENYDSEAEALGQTVYTETFTWKGTDFSDSTLPEKVYEEAQKLSVGAISGVIDCEDDSRGYYVIRLDSEKDEDATNTKISDLQDQKKQDYYNDKIDSWKEAIGGFKLDEDLWAKVTFDEEFEATTLDSTEDGTASDAASESSTDTSDESTIDSTSDAASDSTDTSDDSSANQNADESTN